MQLYRNGVWGNSLWFKKLGAINSATNFLWDFYFMVDNASLSAGQALNFDAFQFVGGLTTLSVPSGLRIGHLGTLGTKRRDTGCTRRSRARSSRRTRGITCSGI